MEKNIVISLGDSRIKEISEVISNKSCNKILDALSEKEATTSELANELKMPLNTVDYNIKKLVKAGLLEKSQHWWSVKGKKMHAYKVSNKKIIISPKSVFKKTFIWVAGIIGMASIFLKSFLARPEIIVERSVSLDSATYGAEKAVVETAQMALAEPVSMSGSSVGLFGGLGPVSWFLIGAALAILLYYLIDLLTERRRS